MAFGTISDVEDGTLLTKISNIVISKAEKVPSNHKLIRFHVY